MRTKTDVQSYLLDLGVPFHEVGDAKWVIEDEAEGIPKIVVQLADPLVVFHIKVMPCPTERREEFLEALLRANVDQMVHGAFGLSGNEVVLLDTLQLENLDFNEFQASIESLDYALAQHASSLAPWSKPEA